MGRGCARHSFPRMQITSVYYFAGEKRREGGFVENNETLFRLRASRRNLEKSASFSDTPSIYFNFMKEKFLLPLLALFSTRMHAGKENTLSYIYRIFKHRYKQCSNI